ncbi:MAG TPA: hypothetical protein VMT55_02530 [Candidatus Sulfotelmatobacter sp.]|nr:hypothetical protein [Candidatus Sulfotelmatobacter sp.]
MKINDIAAIQRRPGLPPIFRLACRPGETITTPGVALRGLDRQRTLLVRTHDNRVAIGRLPDVSALQGTLLDCAPYVDPLLYYDGGYSAKQIAKRAVVEDRLLPDLVADDHQALAKSLAGAEWDAAVVDSGILKAEFQHDHRYATGQALDGEIAFDFGGLMFTQGHVLSLSVTPECLLREDRIELTGRWCLPKDLGAPVHLERADRILAKKVAAAALRGERTIWHPLGDLVVAANVWAYQSDSGPLILSDLTMSRVRFLTGLAGLEVLLRNETVYVPVER